MAENKDTIYIDIDDEITSIIDKVVSSDKKITALVLPKRAAVMQSIVNMKLLKHSADEASKKVVLITSEKGLLPLAGAAGLHVAKTLQTKPEIPSQPKSIDDDSEEMVEDEVLDTPKEPNADSNKSVGELASEQAVKVEPEETIDLDNSEPEETEEKEPKSKSKKNKVPNFNKFRKKLFIGVGAGLLILIVWIFAFTSLPKAKILIKTDGKAQEVNPSITVDTSARTVDAENAISPGTLKEIKKSDSQSAPASGQKDIGKKAKGTLSITNCEDSSSHFLSGGSKFTSSGGRVFTNNKSFTLPAGQFSNGGQDCDSSAVSVSVTALESGESYNIGATTYSSGLLSGDFIISGTKMTGGTSDVVKVVSSSDVESAKDKLTNNDDDAKEELKKGLEDAGLLAMAGTFTAGKASVKATPAIGSEGDTVNVSSTTNYSMLGVKEEDLKKLVEESLKSDIDVEKQTVQDYGFEAALFAVTEKKDNQYKVSIQTTVTIGPKLNIDDVKLRVAGKKRGEIQNDIGAEPGVNEVTVDFSPFWVFKAPKNPEKISVTIESSNDQQNP